MTARGFELKGRNDVARPDFVMLGCMLALSALGVLMIYSSSAPRLEAAGLGTTSTMARQAFFVVLGLAVSLIATSLSDRTWQSLAPIVYGGTLVSLLVVLSPVGALRQGAQRWIDLGFIDLQPAELAKPAVVLALAALLAPASDKGIPWLRVAKAVALVAVPAVLIFVQPDLGTMLVFGFVLVVMLFAAGTSARQIGLLLAMSILALLSAVQLGILRDYQLARLTGFLNAGQQTLSINYNQNQSQIAIGNGGLFGQGLFEGTQTNLAFVPAQTTDFIFTAVGEQLGFVGGALVIGLFLVLIWRMLMVAALARDRFAQLAATGVAAMVAFHVFVNIGMTLGLLPVTGLPLPFVSYGGSFYLAMAISVGIVNAIWIRRARTPGERQLMA